MSILSDKLQKLAEQAGQEYDAIGIVARRFGEGDALESQEYRGSHGPPIVTEYAQGEPETSKVSFTGDVTNASVPSAPCPCPELPEEEVKPRKARESKAQRPRHCVVDGQAYLAWPDDPLWANTPGERVAVLAGKGRRKLEYRNGGLA